MNVKASLQTEDDQPSTRALDQRRIIRQKSKRYPLAVDVARYDGKSGHWRSVNVSEDGCYIAGDPMLEVNEELDVGLWLVGGEQEIVRRARVVWVNQQAAKTVKHLPAGMGLQFIDSDDEARSSLRAQLQELGAAGERAPKGAPQEDAELEPGTVLGAYRILKSLGAGGMGCVYLAEHEVLERKVALKTLHKSMAADPTTVRRFFDEARSVNRINHENIIEITDFVTLGQTNFFVMELLNGQTLGDLQRQPGGLALDRVIDIAAQLAGALAAAHEAGITHRDLKPDNVVVIEKNGRKDFVKLLDFGIAKLAQHDANPARQTQAGMLLGTPGYIAPEQIIGGKADHRSDIYAFGVLLYQMATGQKPFVADTWPLLLVKHMNEPPPLPRVTGIPLPEPLVTLIMSCLAKAPEERPQSMRLVREQLLLIGAGRTPPPLPIDALEPTLVEPLTASVPKRSGRKTQALAFGAALLLAGVLFLPMARSLRVPLTQIFTRMTTGQPEAAPAQTEVAPSVAAPNQALPNQALPNQALPSNAAPSSPVPSSAVVNHGVSPEPAPNVPAAAQRSEADVDAAPKGAAKSKRDSGATVTATPAPSPSRAADSVTTQLEIVAQLLRQKDFAQAVRVSEALLNIAPNHPLVHRGLGIAHSGLAHKTQACVAFRRYLMLAPSAADRDRVQSLLGGCP